MALYCTSVCLCFCPVERIEPSMYGTQTQASWDVAQVFSTVCLAPRIEDAKKCLSRCTGSRHGEPRGHHGDRHGDHMTAMAIPVVGRGALWSAMFLACDSLLVGETRKHGPVRVDSITQTVSLTLLLHTSPPLIG